MADKIGVMVCGHGSRSDAAVSEFAAISNRLDQHFPEWPLEYGYLEFANPVIRVGLDKLRNKGVNHILAVPGMLFAAAHAKNDIPTILASYQSETGIKVEDGRELGVDPKMLRAAADRIEEAVVKANKRHGVVNNSDICLVVIGRGASDPDANSNVSKIARMLWEGVGFGWCEVGYSGVTFPLVEPCLQHVVRLGYKRVIVFPYFLFTGILIDRIYGFTKQIAAQYPEVQLVSAGYLNDHPCVIDTFVERVVEILDGQNVMNCQMCKYRTKVLGFESEVGTPQDSHHHHVEGMGASAPGSRIEDCQLCDTFCTGRCRLQGKIINHHHGHEHQHTYPHVDHPLGPISVLRNNND